MKRLERDTGKRWISGLCAGIGKTYNIDPLAARLSVFFITFITGFMPGVITYVLGWILTPTANQVTPQHTTKEETKNLKLNHQVLGIREHGQDPLVFISQRAQ